MIETDLTYYTDATQVQLEAYAGAMGLDVSGTPEDITYRIRNLMLGYPRLNAIQTEIFTAGRVACLMELQLCYMYWQVAEGLEPKMWETSGTWTRSSDDDFNYRILDGISNYLISEINGFNTQFSSISGLHWTYDNQTAVKPCPLPHFTDHDWGTPYPSAGAFFYPPASGEVPEGWDGLGLGVNVAQPYTQPIDYFFKMAPSGVARGFWSYKDVVSTPFPDETESNQSVRSALNSIILTYDPPSG